MLREQISARACRLWDAWGVGSTGGDPVVPAEDGNDMAGEGRGDLLFRSPTEGVRVAWR